MLITLLLQPRPYRKERGDINKKSAERLNGQKHSLDEAKSEVKPIWNFHKHFAMNYYANMEVNLNSVPSKRPLSLSFNSGITNSARNDIVI